MIGVGLSFGGCAGSLADWKKERLPIAAAFVSMTRGHVDSKPSN